MCFPDCIYQHWLVNEESYFIVIIYDFSLTASQHIREWVLEVCGRRILGMEWHSAVLSMKITNSPKTIVKTSNFQKVTLFLHFQWAKIGTMCYKIYYVLVSAFKSSRKCHSFSPVGLYKNFKIWKNYILKLCIFLKFYSNFVSNVV